MATLANIKVVPCKVFWDGEDFGYLDGDIEVAIEEQGVDVTAHQEGTNVLDMIRTGKSAELVVTLKEAATARLSTLVLAGGATSTPAAEVTEITCLGATAMNSKYFLINTALDAIEHYVWIDENNTGVDPAPTGKTGIAVDVAAAASATAVATAVAAALEALPGYIATSSGAVVTVTNASTGACTDAEDGDSGATFEVTTQGIGAVVGWGSTKDFASMLADAKKLVLHPMANADSVLTDDLAFWKAYPIIDGITHSGENPKTISVTFKIFPDLTRAAAVRMFVLGDHR